MSVVDPFRAALRLAPPGLKALGVPIAILVFLERVLAPATVYLFVLQRALDGFLAGSLLAAVILARGAAQRSFTPRTEAALYRRVVGAVLGGDVLQPSLLPDEEARVSLFEGLHRVATLFVETVPGLAANLAAAPVVASFVAMSQPLHVTWVAAAALAVGGAGLYLCRGWVERAQDDAWWAWDRVAEGVANGCDGRLELVAAGLSRDFLERFADVTRTWSARAVRAGRVAGVSGRLPMVLLAVSVGGAVYVDAWQHGVPWSLASVRAGLLASAAPAFIGLVRCLQELMSNEPRLKLVERVIEAGIARRGGTVPPKGVPACVEWKAVHVAYANDGPEALRGASFQWQSGELLGLTGANGSGKSTCLRALLGFGSITAGDVTVDGVVLRDLDLIAWRRAIAFLPQRPYLPPRATVRSCLRFIDADTPEDVMNHALERVGVMPRLWLESHDPLSVTVDALSVGERQRVALARVLCRPCPLVLLDEPDANLDRDGIELVANLVVELARDRMVLVVAHTPELLRLTGRVITLEAGRVLSDVTRT